MVKDIGRCRGVHLIWENRTAWSARKIRHLSRRVIFQRASERRGVTSQAVVKEWVSGCCHGRWAPRRELGRQRTPPKTPLKRMDQSDTANRKPPTNHRHSLLSARIVIQNKNFSVILYEERYVFGWKGNSELRWPQAELHSSDLKV